MPTTLFTSPTSPASPAAPAASAAPATRRPTLRRRHAAALLVLPVAAAACGLGGAPDDPYGALSGAGPAAQEGATAKGAAPAPGAGAADAPAPGPDAAAAVFRVVEGQSRATFRVHQEVAPGASLPGGLADLPEEVVGTTGAVSGQLAFRPDGTLRPDASKIVVDLRELQTGIALRDTFIKTNTLATGRFPTAEFAPARADGLPTPLPADGEHRFTLTGPMTVHGVQQEVTWDVTATRRDATVTGTATSRITFADFGLTAPSLPFLHAVAEDIALEVSLVAEAPPPPAA
jgi:polyisoprenoid-binding protein YceI